jgi:hypothetical protein
VSIAKAQIRELQQSFIQSIGDTEFDKVNPKDLPILERVLAIYGQAFNTRITEILDKENITSSGKLANPAEPILTKFGTGYILSVGYEKGSEQDKYFRFINKGVLGTTNEKADPNTPYKFDKANKYVNIGAVEKWLSYNKLKTVAVKKYTKLGVEAKAIESKKSLAFVIARSIHRKGITSTYYFDRAVAQIFNKDFVADVALAVGGDVQIQIKQIVNEVKNGNNNNK